MNNSETIDYIKLENNTGILIIDEPKTKSNKLYENELWVVLDRSGSMGQSANKIVRAIPLVLNQVNLNLVKLFTFDSISEYKEIKTIDLINNNDIVARGGTEMLMTLKQLFEKLNNVQDKIIQIMVISDGEVMDKHKLLDHTKSMIINYVSTNYIQVMGVMLNNGGRPDTQALTCVFCLNNFPSFTPQLRECTGETIQEIFTEIGKTFSANLNLSKNVLESKISCMKYNPWEKLSNLINLPCKKNFVIIQGEPENLTINGQEIIINRKELDNELELEQLFIRIESNIRNWKVLGSGEETTLDGINFIKIIQNYFNKVGVEFDNYDLRQRIKHISKITEKNMKSLCNRILELANLSNIEKLNSIQQADFLRQLDPSKSSKDIARRSKVKDASELETLVKNSMAKLLTEIKNLKDCKDLPVSFYNLCNNVSALQSLEDIKDNFDSINLEDLLQIVGINGICFKANIGNFVDPWRFRVQKVFNGVYLSQHDLWAAHKQSNGKSLTIPGNNKDIITGVDPIRNLNSPMSFDIYMKQHIFNDLHASITMRRIVSPISSDMIALKTAVILKMIEQFFENILTEVSIQEFFENLSTLKWIVSKTNIFSELKEDINKPNFEAYLTGDKGISDEMKVICFLLCSDNIKELDIPRIIRALYVFNLNHKIRNIVESMDRTKKIEELLEIDYENKGTKPTKLFELEPDILHFCSEFNTKNLNMFCDQHCTNLKNFQRLCFVLELLGSGVDSKVFRSKIEQNIKECENWMKIDEDLDDYNRSLVIQCISNPNLADRVDTEKREMKILDLTSKIIREKYMKNIVSEIYEENYKKLLKNKINEQDKILLIQAMDEMVSINDLNNFVQKLNTFIPNTFTEGFENLLDKLKNLTIKVPLRASKLRLILVGHDINGNAIWNNGNIYRTDINSFSKYFDNFDNNEEHFTWESVENLHKKNSRHIYREGMANRHGHCNECPSYWAIGSKNQKEYESYLLNEYGPNGIIAYNSAKRYNMSNSDKKTIKFFA